MNAKLNPINSAKVMLGVGAVTLTVLAMSFKPFATTEYTTPTVQTSKSYDVVSVQSAEILDSSHGVAVVKMDDFILTVPFYFEAHLDNYGVPGSEFTAVTINEVGEIKIKDINGHEYRDFTVYDDVVQIKELIRGYIEKNQLVELEVV